MGLSQHSCCCPFKTHVANSSRINSSTDATSFMVANCKALDGNVRASKTYAWNDVCKDGILEKCSVFGCGFVPDRPPSAASVEWFDGEAAGCEQLKNYVNTLRARDMGWKRGDVKAARPPSRNVVRPSPKRVRSLHSGVTTSMHASRVKGSRVQRPRVFLSRLLSPRVPRPRSMVVKVDSAAACLGDRGCVRNCKMKVFGSSGCFWSVACRQV